MVEQKSVSIINFVRAIIKVNLHMTKAFSTGSEQGTVEWKASSRSVGENVV
jgi:hypothetical protein